MTKTTSNTNIERPPVVVVMGHVDHGKSSLLDFIRKSNIVAGEHGGITQHVAAYEVVHNDKHITFIDTPGHAAFSAIRARGANVADIAILVVAADDGVKAQTLEALAQIREAKIPFIVAFNKIDKPNIDMNRAQASIMEHEVYLENMGGDVPWVAVSAKVGTGVDKLLDLVLLVAEVQEFKADTSVPAEGWVVEAHRDQKRGIAATLIISNGTLVSGNAIVAGHAVAPVRIMENHLGKTIREATFSSPITLVGFDEMPAVGEKFSTYANKREAETVRDTTPRDAVVAFAESLEGQYTMPLILRADTTGSLQALLSEIAKLGDEHARISVVQSGIGTISEGDIKSALVGDHKAPVIGFNVGVDPVAESLALERGVSTESFTIIYKLTEKLEELLKSAAPERSVEEIVGRAKIMKIFSSRKREHVLGGAVIEGHLAKKVPMRIVRRGTLLGKAHLLNIQSNKINSDRVDAPAEFGAQIEATFEPAPGDTIECFITTIV